MIWIKSAFVGLLAAIVTEVAVNVAIFAWIINVQIAAGSGGIGAVSAGIIELVLLPSALAFALAFWWMLRRQRGAILRQSR